MDSRQVTYVRKPPEDSSDEDVMVHETPRRFPGESQGGTTITLATKTPERLRSGLDLVSRASLPIEPDPGWRLPASTAPSSLGQAEGRLKRKREGTVNYREDREGRDPTSIGVSHREPLDALSCNLLCVYVIPYSLLSAASST